MLIQVLCFRFQVHKHKNALKRIHSIQREEDVHEIRINLNAQMIV